MASTGVGAGAGLGLAWTIGWNALAASAGVGGAALASWLAGWIVLPALARRQLARAVQRLERDTHQNEPGVLVERDIEPLAALAIGASVLAIATVAWLCVAGRSRVGGLMCAAVAFAGLYALSVAAALRSRNRRARST